MKKRSWLLPFIVFLIVASLLGLLAISGWGIYSQQNAMIHAAEDLAMRMAQDLAGEPADPPQQGQFHRSESSYSRRSRRQKMLDSGPPAHGWVAIFDNEGKYIDGSDGSSGSRGLPEITESVKAAVKQKEKQTATIRIDRNPPSALAAVPCTDGDGVAVAVISHYLVPPNMKSVINAMSYYGAAIIAGICIASFGVLLLWKYCIHPLRTLAGRIDDLQWGRDTLCIEHYEPLPEIEGMQRALCDLSERAVEQENLKNSYESATIRSREDERSVLADNIHDYPLQTVLSLVQRIQLASRAASRDVPNMERIKNHLSLAEESGQTAVSQLREACNKLSPPWLSLGAKRALEQVSASLSDLYKVRITTDVETGEKAPSKRHVREMCHIVQAAVENSAYHGDAQNVRIALRDDGSAFVLTVSDDGHGMTEGPIVPQDPAALHKRGWHGIAEMTERANSMDGTLRISNSPAGGAVLTVTMPCTLHDTFLKSPSHWTLGADSDLRTLSIELSREHHANVTASVEGNDSGLSKRLLNEMCRTVRQATANSVHHGHAENIQVKLSCEEDRYVLTIRDDGTGLQSRIDPEQLRAEGHRGIAGMTERTQMFGGTFELCNAEDGGAIVTMTVPKS